MKTITDEDHYRRAMTRIGRMMAVLAAAGVMALAVWRGWRWGAGFGVGAGASWLSFRWMKQMADALGRGGRPRRRIAVLAGLRYVLLGGGAYVILRYSSISLPAALAGLFVSVAAVIVEILFELAYARN